MPKNILAKFYKNPIKTEVTKPDSIYGRCCRWP